MFQCRADLPVKLMKQDQSRFGERLEIDRRDVLVRGSRGPSLNTMVRDRSNRSLIGGDM